jgi:antitoxin VapB
MKTTRVFRSGHSQAVRIPRAYRFRSSEVEILRRGDEIVLREHPKNLVSAFELLAGLSPDFFSKGRRQPRLDRRIRL